MASERFLGAAKFGAGGKIALSSIAAWSEAMRRLLKFGHTLGAIGLMGSMAALLVLLDAAPRPGASLSGYAEARTAMGTIATWLFFPSLAVTLISGLASIAVTRGFHNAGWAWLKAGTGILLFESGFAGVLGPKQNEAERSAKALAGALDPATLAMSLSAERGTLWVLLAVAAANVALGVWRPRLVRRPS